MSYSGDYIEDPPKFECWNCNQFVTKRAGWNTWTCTTCDVQGYAGEIVQSNRLEVQGPTFRFSDMDHRVHDEPYVDHTTEHVPCP